MATTIHGGLPEGVRDHHNVFGAKSEPTPQARLEAARAKVEELNRNHAEDKDKLRSAIDDNDDTPYDFSTLKANVHRLASELAEAEEEVANWESVCGQLEKSNRQQRCDAALI